MMNPGYEQQGNGLEEELLRVQLEIQERELEMIRTEIFDNVGQVLSLAKLQLSAQVPSENEYLSRTMASSKKLVGKAIQDLRQMARPVTISEIREKGLLHALAHELETLGRIHNKKLGFIVNDKIDRFDTASELIAFRLLQELLAVFVEVSGNRNILTTVDIQESRAHFVVSNTPSLHLALPGVWMRTSPYSTHQMQIRADMISADLRISGMPDGELIILLVLPLRNLEL